MKPPMNQTVMIYNPSTETDEYDRPIKQPPFESKARVQRKNKVVYSANGSEFETTLEIDLPPEVEIGYQTEISYTDLLGNEGKGTIRAIEESTNLAGNRVYFRTVNVE